MTDPRIGPALADSIACLARRSGRDVIVIAHSMGGLAVRFAQGQTVDGTRISGLLDRVVTIGTPSDGSQLLAAAGSVVAPAFDALLDGAREICGNPMPKRPTRAICDLLGAEGTPAVQGLVPGSSTLAALPAWDPRLVVHAVAANLTLYISVLGVEQSFGVGDIVVSVDSATASASKGEPPFVVNCRSTLDGAVDAINDSPCRARQRALEPPHRARRARPGEARAHRRAAHDLTVRASVREVHREPTGDDQSVEKLCARTERE